MISLNSVLNRLDLVFYIIVFAIIYVAIIYLWKKIAQLESSFYKLETTFATQLLYKNKENTANNFAEDMFMKVFDNKQEQSAPIQVVEEQPNDIIENTIQEDKDSTEPIITEINDILTKYNATKQQLPKFLSTDPIPKYFNAKPGTIFKILSKSATVGEAVRYRIVR